MCKMIRSMTFEKSAISWKRRGVYGAKFSYPWYETSLVMIVKKADEDG